MGCCASGAADDNEEQPNTQEPSSKSKSKGSKKQSKGGAGSETELYDPLLKDEEEHTRLRAFKQHPRGTRRFELHEKVNRMLDSGADSWDIVKLPDGEDWNGFVFGCNQ